MQRAGIATITVGLVALVIGSFLPWATSGTRQRSSYELVRVADRLDLLPGGWMASVARLWFAMPLVAALTASAPLWPHARLRRSAPVATMALSVLALVLVVLVHRSPLSTDVGTTTSAAGAAVALIGAAVATVGGLAPRPTPIRR